LTVALKKAACIASGLFLCDGRSIKTEQSIGMNDQAKDQAVQPNKKANDQ
jgi:hypothetical protein